MKLSGRSVTEQLREERVVHVPNSCNPTFGHIGKLGFLL